MTPCSSQVDLNRCFVPANIPGMHTCNIACHMYVVIVIFCCIVFIDHFDSICKLSKWATGSSCNWHQREFLPGLVQVKQLGLSYFLVYIGAPQISLFFFVVVLFQREVVSFIGGSESVSATQSSIMRFMEDKGSFVLVVVSEVYFCIL